MGKQIAHLRNIGPEEPGQFLTNALSERGETELGKAPKLDLVRFGINREGFIEGYLSSLTGIRIKER